VIVIGLMPQIFNTITVTVTVTEALVLRPLLEDRRCITESIRILVSVDRMKQKCFQITTKQVRRSQQFNFGYSSTSAEDWAAIVKSLD